MTIKSFRGKIADGAIEEINLRTNNGKMGYKILKFQIVTSAPSTSSEHLCQVWRNPHTAEASKTDVTIDFANQDLLAVALWSNDSAAQTYSDDFHVIFDNVIFNQNIFVTNQTITGSNFCNYHIELEQIKLSDNETTMATLQSIRSQYESYTPAGPS